jgi:hypothetical protein
MTDRSVIVLGLPMTAFNADTEYNPPATQEQE